MGRGKLLSTADFALAAKLDALPVDYSPKVGATLQPVCVLYVKMGKLKQGLKFDTYVVLSTETYNAWARPQQKAGGEVRLAKRNERFGSDRARSGLGRGTKPKPADVAADSISASILLY